MARIDITLIGDPKHMEFELRSILKHIEDVNNKQEPNESYLKQENGVSFEYDPEE